jgi:hypothetical protein
MTLLLCLPRYLQDTKSPWREGDTDLPIEDPAVIATEEQNMAQVVA